MNVLITSAASRTAKIVIESLRTEYSVTLTDLPGNSSGEMVSCDLGHEGSTKDLVNGVDAIVNIGFQGQSGNATHLMDYHTRCMYNLLEAASGGGVARFVNVSTLRLYEDHEENLVVTERWRPDPSAENVDLLSAHLCEAVCKEFARDRLIQVVNLRLGWPFVPDISPVTTETAAISHELIVAAIRESLVSKELGQWQDIHVQSPIEHQRFISDTAGKLLPGLLEGLGR